MENNVKDIEVEETLEKLGYYLSTKSDFDAKVEEVNEGTQFPKEKRMEVDLGNIGGDEGTKFNQRSKSNDMESSLPNVWRRMEQLKKDIFDTFVEIYKNFDYLNKMYNFVVTNRELGVVVSSI